MIKFRSHQTANSREYRDGCPGAWPQIEERVSDSRRLTADEIAAGFSLLTEDEHAALRAQYRPAWDAWEAARKVTEDTDVQTKRTEAKAALDALEAVRTKVGDFNLRQLSDFARLEARLWQTVIRNAPELFER